MAILVWLLMPAGRYHLALVLRVLTLGPSLLLLAVRILMLSARTIKGWTSLLLVLKVVVVTPLLLLLAVGFEQGAAAVVVGVPRTSLHRLAWPLLLVLCSVSMAILVRPMPRALVLIGS